MANISAKLPEDSILDSDEPSEAKSSKTTGLTSGSPFVKALPPRLSRRESLLTRQLHASESDSHTEDEHRISRQQIFRGLSASTDPSIASTAELTSDNELTSPGTRNSSPSPSLLPTRSHFIVPVMDKPIAEEPRIAQHDDDTEKPTTKPAEPVESGLGRRRCITFACGGKKASPPKPEKKSGIALFKEEQETTEPPKRKCALTFACPTRVSAQPASSNQQLKPTRHASPAPRSPRSPRMVIKHAHRGSDSTIKNDSPKSLRKVPSAIKRRKYSEDVDDNQSDLKSFHEFGTTTNADDDWIQEATCHRSRLTIKDTLHKENVIRQIGEEVEEEALDDDEDEDEEELLDDLDDDDDEDEMDDDDEDLEEDVHSAGHPRDTAGSMLSVDHAVSDAGFDTDDEGGFAGSDSEGDDSDYEWWAPGGSTAATSADHLDHIRPAPPRRMSDSSLESSRQANGLASKSKIKRKSHAVNINRPVTPDLPDSTDFVCGTLDEDRPLEQAYITCMAQKKAAKHKIIPQDIDPTFPTSDPEMDEEDEDDSDGQEDDDADQDEQPLFMHGKLELSEDRGRRSRTNSSAGKKKSPSPRRLRSPPPPTHRVVHRSPPPPTKKHILRSPPPPPKRLRSPAPPSRLFSHSPKRMRSPPPSHRLTSPANSRRSSADSTPSHAITMPPSVLGSRPQPTHTASLPRVPTVTRLNSSAINTSDDEEEGSSDVRTRGAIDIVKGLEKKRQRRKEKLYQKHCLKMKKEAEKKPKPGKGAQRMREVGLELAAYRGKKAEHMLSY